MSIRLSIVALLTDGWNSKSNSASLLRVGSPDFLKPLLALELLLESDLLAQEKLDGLHGGKVFDVREKARRSQPGEASVAEAGAPPRFDGSPSHITPA